MRVVAILTVSAVCLFWCGDDPNTETKAVDEFCEAINKLPFSHEPIDFRDALVKQLAIMNLATDLAEKNKALLTNKDVADLSDSLFHCVHLWDAVVHPTKDTLVLLNPSEWNQNKETARRYQNYLDARRLAVRLAERIKGKR